MRKYNLYLVSFLLIFNQVFSQWQLLKGVGENQFIKNVEVENDKIVISISNNIYMTTNFGEKWTHINENTDKHFNLNINTFNLSFYNNNVFLISSSNEDPGIYSTDVDLINWKFNSKGLPQLASDEFKLYSNESGVYAYSGYYQNLWLYNDKENIWKVPYDTNGFKKFSIHSVYIDSNYYYFGTGYNPEAIPKTGCKTPNFFKIDKKTGKLYSTLDSNSEICRYYILSLNQKDNLLLAGTTGGFYISTNYGDNWFQTKSNLIYQDSIYKNNYNYQKLLVKDNYIYALVTEYTQYGDFQDGYNATLIYSTDNGDSWQFPNYNMLFPGSYGIILNVRDLEFYKNGLLLATSDGLYHINKELTQIQEINTKNLSGETVFNLYHSNYKLFALVGWRTPTTGLWTSSDYGNTWKCEQNELRGRFMHSIDVKDSIVITGSDYSGYPWISKDFGKSFTEVKSNIFEQNNVVISTKIIDDIIYIGTTKGVICSKDQGLTWYKLSNILDKYIIYDIIKINNLLFITTENKILRSSDEGKTWEESNFQKDNNLSYYFDKLTVCEKKIFAICSIYEQSGIYITPIGGTIYSSIDSGKTWIEVNKGLPNYDGISSFCCYGKHKFISGDNSIGVFYDASTNPKYIFWRPINYGLTDRSITTLIHDGRYLYAATASGIYRVLLSDFGITDVEDSEIEVEPDYLWATLGYPNPASNYAQAKVWWDTHNDIEKAEIAVYNIYGNRVSGREKVTIMPENEYSGILRWDCSGVPSGVYILIIQHGTRKQAIKIIKN